jgi:hypothetical protein
MLRESLVVSSKVHRACQLRDVLHQEALSRFVRAFLIPNLLFPATRGDEAVIGCSPSPMHE